MTHPHDAVQPRTCVVCGWRALTPAQAHVCTRCERTIREHLMELADNALLLPHAVAAPRGAEGRLPVRVAVLDLTLPARTRPVRPTGEEDATGESITATLAYWAVRWSHIAPALGYRPSNSVGSVALWLFDQLHWACGVQSGIEEMAADVRAQVAAARRALDLTAGLRQPAVTLTAACRCGETTLRRVLGADWIDCTACKRLYTDNEYTALVREDLDDHLLLTASEAAVALGVPVQRVWKWASRNYVEAVVIESGRPRYRLEDLRDVHRQTELHRAGRCEIGVLTVSEDGEIVQGELVEYDAPTTVFLHGIGGVGEPDEHQNGVVVHRGETRWFGPAALGTLHIEPGRRDSAGDIVTTSEMTSR